MTLSCIKGAATIATAVAALGAAGCGGIGPGDYVMYRVAVSEAAYSADCDVTDNVKNDKNTFRDSTTFILYAGADDAYYLDTGSTTMEGAEDEEGYTFKGEHTDIETFGADSFTAKDSLTVTMVVDGAAVNGSIKSKTSLTYVCANPATCPPNETCTQTYTYVGSEIEDVDLEHDPS